MKAWSKAWLIAGGSYICVGIAGMGLNICRVVTGYDARGTIHNWVNHGTAPCVIAFVLISSDGHTAVG